MGLAYISHETVYQQAKNSKDKIHLVKKFAVNTCIIHYIENPDMMSYCISQ